MAFIHKLPMSSFTPYPIWFFYNLWKSLLEIVDFFSLTLDVMLYIYSLKKTYCIENDISHWRSRLYWW